MHGPASSTNGPLDAFCERVLTSGDLASKLAEPPLAARADSNAPNPRPPRAPHRPARAPGLRMRSGGGTLPRPEALVTPEARAICLARFAHHELQAVEYFAWALLRWPDAPAALRRGWLAALRDEQRHCRLYLDRLQALGGHFETDDHSDYLWQQVEAIASAENDLCAFLAAMGLTFEQANLDFTLTYRDAFAAAGDMESAALCQRVHDEEITHVALALRWLERLSGPPTPPIHGDPGLDAYVSHVPFPLGPARAKGRHFAPEPRAQAGFSPAFIEHVRSARGRGRELRPFLLMANLGAEEESPGSEARPLPGPARTAAALWSLCFPQQARWIGPAPTQDGSAAGWPRRLGAPASEPVFAFLDVPDALHAWLNTPSAQESAERLGVRLAGPAPEIVREVHDKAFATKMGAILGGAPGALADLIEALTPAELADPDRLLDRLEARLQRWPAWTGRRFTLKPRFGSSGRGRIAGEQSIDRERLRGGIARLARRGGAVFEPWLERRGDFSVALHIAAEDGGESGPGITVLGSLECWNSESGVYRGHFGEIDSRGRVFSGDRDDEAFRADAAAVAAEARVRGFWGPCGVDGFRYVQPKVGFETHTRAAPPLTSGPTERVDDEETPFLRTIVEFNARPTMGLVAIGLARRALPRVRKRLGLEPGTRYAFALTQRAPDDRDWRRRIYAQIGSDCLILDLSGASRSGDPLASLVFARDPETLRAARSSAFDC